jgi:hypothetical protein
MIASHFEYVKEETITLPNGVTFNDFGFTDLLRKGMRKMEDSNVSASLLGQLKGFDTLSAFAKTNDAPLQTTTTAAVNPIYGAQVYSWLNSETNFFAALAKQPWGNSGIRVKTAHPTTKITGLGETDALPASTLPTYKLLRFPLKQMATRFDWTAKMSRQAASGDDCIPTPTQLAQDVAEAHQLGISESLLANAETAAANASANYSGVTVTESIDRVISCDAEEDDLGGNHINWYNPYTGTATIDRDNETTYDSVVVHGDGTIAGGIESPGNPNFTEDATLTLDAIDTLYFQLRENGAKQENLFFLTGWDTLKRIKQLIDPKVRVVNPMQVTFNVNGVSTEKGSDYSFEVNSYQGVPIIVDQNCPKDTISKLFCIDRSNVFLRVATPTTAIDLGFPALSTQTSLAQRFGYGKILLTEMELVCTRYNTSGKLCALK